MKLEIFKKDIATAEQYDCQNCVIAKALCRLPFPEGANRVEVDGVRAKYYGLRPEGSIWDSDRPLVKIVPLPREVQRYIHKFDNNEKIVPTVFNIPGL